MCIAVILIKIRICAWEITVNKARRRKLLNSSLSVRHILIIANWISRKQIESDGRTESSIFHSSVEKTTRSVDGGQGRTRYGQSKVTGLETSVIG